MALHYVCRHCKTTLGTVNETTFYTQSLGFHHLTEQERQEMIRYESNGDMTVTTICEDCHEALTRNPDLYELENIIQ